MERPENLLEVAAEAARLGGSVLESRFGQSMEIRTKSSPIDLVTEMDLKSERVIVDYITRHFPKHEVLAEENTYGEENRGGPYKWIIDPLDGTTNYAHGFPFYAVSIAVAVLGELTAGVIYHPPLKELFAVVRGGGAELNGRKLHVSGTEQLGQALLVTGFPYDVRKPPHTNLEYFVRFTKHARAVRRVGSAAMDLAYVAAGRFDGYWEITLQPWDMAAGILMVEEAGGRVSDVGGQAPDIYKREIVASNGMVHDEMLQLLAD
ncbi:MAG TPA: inositol monophosphatase family protein [Acidobacteriota bacterium]|jgi:myo-inositol-1(or 4)-monophosphatase